MKFKDLKDGQEFMYPGWDCVLFKDGDKALEEDDFYGDSDDDMCIHENGELGDVTLEIVDGKVQSFSVGGG